MKRNSKISLTVIAFSLLIAMSSCGLSDESSKNSSENAQTTQVTTEATTEITKTSTTENKDTNSSETSSTTNEQVDPDSLKYDFTGLDSGEMVQSFKDGKYMISYYIKGVEDTIQTLYFDKDKALVHISSRGVEYDMIYKDNKKYNVCNNYIYTEDTEDSPDSAGTINIFGQLGYMGSDSTEFDGKVCKYDEYYDKTSGMKTKIFINDDGKIIAFEEAGSVLYVTDYSSDFDSDKIISVPENCEVLSKDKFTILMYQLYNKAEGTTQATVNSEESTKKNQ